MKKKPSASIAVGLALFMLAAVLGMTSERVIAADQGIRVVINQEEVIFPDQAPYVSSNGSIMVPARFVADNMGIEPVWHQEDQSIALDFGDPLIKMQAGSGEALVNGTPRTLVSPPEILNGRFCIPLRFLSEALNLEVIWDSAGNAALLNGELPAAPPEPDSFLDTVDDYYDQPADDGSEAQSSVPSLGPNASLNGYRLFPEDNPWNQRVDDWPVDPDSDKILERMGFDKSLKADFGSNWNGGPFGIPYIVVDGSTPRVPMIFEYNDESDPGPYPIPADAPVEKGSDRHILVLDRDNQLLYETYNAWPEGLGYTAGSGAIFNLRSNALRPVYWTSADAAGLPMLPGLARYDEVIGEGKITHALRVTVDETRHAFVAPATHFASDDYDPYLPPMGARIRLKKDFDTSGFPSCVQVILEGLKTYGMYVADNGASFYISGAPDARWNDEELATIRQVTADNLEIVQMGKIITDY